MSRAPQQIGLGVFVLLLAVGAAATDADRATGVAAIAHLRLQAPLPIRRIREDGDPDAALDARLRRVLRAQGFTGGIESTLERRLGRPIDGKLANLGQLLFFDVAGGLHDDNTCAGCHAPAAGFGDTQSIAIGIQSNRMVGPSRAGPRNQRRTPSVVNTAFYPALMWNDRFAAPSGDPFDNSKGYAFPRPEGTTKFLPRDPIVTHLLIAQAHIPPTELVEVAGFTGTFGTLEPLFAVEFATSYDPAAAGVAPDLLQTRRGPIAPVLARLDPLLASANRLSPPEFNDLVAFVRESLTDPGARPAAFCRLIPTSVPSGRPLLTFEGCAPATAP